MTSSTIAGVSTQYGYDTNGNRTGQVIGATSYPDSIAPTSNQMTALTNAQGSYSIQYDGAGHVINDGVNGYSYSARGRMSSATTTAGTVGFLYNALDQRVYKGGSPVPSGAAYYVYDESGRLLGEYDANGAPLYETIYAASMPVGAIKQSGSATNATLAAALYNVHADQLGAPRMITRADQQIVWRWDAVEAFGASAPDQNPNGLGAWGFNQRLPGQVYDGETGLYQNWHREYSSRIGRYVQSDPIGLGGGINTYSYVSGTPLVEIDPFGLQQLGVGIQVPASAAIKNGVLDVGIDPGHTMDYLKDENNNIIGVVSIGPAKTMGTAAAIQSLMGQLDARSDWSLSGPYDTRSSV